MRKNSQNKNGSAVIEFALLMSLLLIPLLAGVWDASKLIDMNQVLTRAAREGVVLASRGDDPITNVISYIEDAGYAADNLTVTVEHGLVDPDFGQEVSITLSYNFAESTVYPWDNLLPGGLNVAAHAKME